MQVSVESSSGLERHMKVGVPAERVDKAVAERLQKASKTVRIKGFRQGKVPIKVVKQYYGKGVRQEVVGEMVNSTFYEAIQQQSLRPVGQPKIEELQDKEGSDLEYTATFEIFPDVKLTDLGSVSIKRPVADVTDADVDNMVETLRKQQASYEKVDRAAIQGDQLNIDYKGKRDGEEFPGGSATGQDLVLGSGSMIAGFEEGLLGAVAGVERTLDLQFPDDYHAEDLQGAKVQFAVKVNSVSEQKLPELDKEFFQIYGVNEGGFEDFKSEVRGNMERELRNALRNKVKNRILSQLHELNSVELPNALIKQEVTQLKRQMVQQFGGGQQIDLNILPDDMFLPQAKRRAALGVIVAEIVKSEALKADPQKVRSRIEEIASTYEQPAEVIDYYYSQEQLLGSVEAAVLEEQVSELVLSRGTIQEEQVSYEEAIKPDPEPALAETGDARSAGQPE